MEEKEREKEKRREKEMKVEWFFIGFVTGILVVLAIEFFILFPDLLRMLAE